MANDDLRVRQKFNSTETKTIKPEQEETKPGKVKTAKIQVGQELGKTSATNPDVDLTQTTKKRAEQNQSEELAMLDDIDAMALIPDDNETTDNVSSGNLQSVINTMKTVNDTISNMGNNEPKAETKALSVDEILDKLKHFDTSKLMILILGPTAKLLAADLHSSGYRALDLGHIAKDYDAFCKKLNKDSDTISSFFAPD